MLNPHPPGWGTSASPGEGTKGWTLLRLRHQLGHIEACRGEAADQ